jgi:inner membrane protein YhjD
VSLFDRTLKRVDGFQQRHAWLAFPIAVAKKFGDDRAGNLAALIAYYGFFSLFPLLLVLVGVLGLVLRGHPDLERSVIDSAIGQFPIIGDQIRNNVKSVAGSNVTLGIGTLTALWAGLGVTQAAQNAMNEIWDVPIKDRPNFLIARLRGLIMLVVLGILVLASTLLSTMGTAEARFAGALRVAGFAGSLALNLALYLVAFRVLTRKKLSWGDVFPGALIGAVLWTGLQAGGSYLMNHQVKHATAVYGFFGFVIGLLAWIYLGAQLTLYAAEVNVVRVRHLWPRSLVSPPLDEADRQTLTAAAKVEERIPEESVDVSFGDRGEQASAPEERKRRAAAEAGAEGGERNRA